MIINSVWPELDGIDPNDMCIPENGAVCHSAYALLDILQEQFEGMVVPHGCDVN